MDFKSLVFLCLNVLKDWRVIAVTIGAIFFISLGNYVVRYKKRPPKVKKIKIAPAPAKPAESKPEDEGDSE